MKTAFAATMTVAFAAILSLSGPQRASAGEPRGEAEVADTDDDAVTNAECSDHTLRGDYAFVIDGTIFTPASSLPKTSASSRPTGASPAHAS